MAGPSKANPEGQPPLDQEMLADFITAGGGAYEDGITDPERWGAHLLEQFGEGARPYLQPAWDAIAQIFELPSTGKEFSVLEDKERPKSRSKAFWREARKGAEWFRTKVRLSPKLLWVLPCVVVALFFGISVWPTPYHYDHMDIGRGVSFLVRINRFTGGTEILKETGWEAVPTPPPQRELTADELRQLDAHASIPLDDFRLELHNGSDLVLTEVSVEVTVLNEDGSEKMVMRYTLLPATNSYCGPQQQCFFSADYVFVGSHWSWRMLSAKGESK